MTVLRHGKVMDILPDRSTKQYTLYALKLPIRYNLTYSQVRYGKVMDILPDRSTEQHTLKQLLHAYIM